jgi:hypothetical protein
MASYTAGDKVFCRIKDGSIISNDTEEFDEIKTFEVIASDTCGYYLFVPQYVYLQGTNSFSLHRCRKLGIDDRYTNEQIIYISENAIYNTIRKDGMSCSICNNFVSMAEPNRDDQETFVCWSCRTNPDF